jgi:phage shock protein PspC (stress-responsive transcriptional regulator)
METAPPASGLARSVEDRVVAGVAGGLGDHFGVRSEWVRLGFVVGALVWGVGLIAYALLWITLPESTWGEEEEVRPPLATDNPRGVLGVILLTLGLLVLVWKILDAVSFLVVLPVVLIAAGAYLLRRTD